MTDSGKIPRQTRRQFLGGAAMVAGSWLAPSSALEAEGSKQPDEPSPAVLRVGFGQVDITPPVGARMTGAGIPPSVGVDDPLFATALVAGSGSRSIAIVGIDLVKIRFDLAEAAAKLAADRTGIDQRAIIVCASHNHSSPLVPMGGPNNRAYLSTLPARIADSVERAYKAMQPARMSLGRSLVFDGLHNRRVVSKADGLVLNTWLPKLDDLQQTPQVLGTEGPIDPELWVARFDTLDGRVLGVLVNFTCHPNLHDRRGRKWSADFPAVIAERIKQAYGQQAKCVFTQGASGNINPNAQFVPNWRRKAMVFADAAVAAAKRATPVEGLINVDCVRRDVEVPWRDPKTERPEAIARLGWRRNVGGAPPEHRPVPVTVARIGPLAIATNAGELFVEWGIAIKKRSPFAHTIISELTNGWIGYEPTAEAFAHEGYETLPGVNFVPLEGVQKLVDTAVELLHQLWEKRGRVQ